MSATLGASATLTATALPGGTTYEYTLSLTNLPTSTTGIATFWFAWDDAPDLNFMTVQPTQITTPTGWFGLVTHGPANPDGYGIQFYTFNGSTVQPGATLTGFSFRSTETPAEITAPAPNEPIFNTLASFVYPEWPPVVGGTTGFSLTVACFAEGTRILTTRGPIAVEDLAIGDEVITLPDRLAAPVRWIGHRRIACGRHPRPHDVMPVRVHRHAFGPDMPSRDVRLSPDHAVALNGVLIPVRYLLNGATIVQEHTAHIGYYHVELDRHAVLLADGLPAESYLDTGNRGAFANAAAVHLHADFARRVWVEQACAKLVTEGPPLAAARRHLLALAGKLGHALTDDPALHAVLADGRIIAPDITGQTYRFVLPAATQTLHLACRRTVPSHILPESDDCRSLGVAIAAIRLDGVRQDVTEYDTGWHTPEYQGEIVCWRWTDGDAALAVHNARVLDVDVAMSGHYWRDAAPQAVAV